MEKDGHFSSFFMMLLSATGLIVILSNFFSGNFDKHISAKTPAPATYYEYQEPEVIYEDEYVEDAEVQGYTEEAEFPTETPLLDSDIEVDTSF